LTESDVAFDEFDGDEAEDQRANDGLTSHKVGRVVKVVPSELRVLEPEQEFGAEGGASDGSCDYGPTDWSRERIAESAAE